MTAYIGLSMLFGIVVLIVILGIRTKQNSNRTNQFYQTNSLVPVELVPATIFEAVGAGKFYARAGKLKTTGAAEIPFFWCEWSLQSTIISGNSRQTATDYFFAAAFAPELVSEEFMRQALQFADKSSDDFTQKLKNFFVLNTEKPYRAEKLSDGSFLMCWRAKNLSEDYERAFLWLKNNISPRRSETDSAKTQEILTVKPEITKFAFLQFLEEMTAQDQDKSRDIINLTDSMIADYHDNKSHPNLSLKDHAAFLEMSLEEAETANRSISQIEFSPDEFLAKGFEIPELREYEYQLAYKLDFPSRTLIYLDRAKIFLDELETPKIYVK